MRDLKNNLSIVHLLDPQDVAGSDTASLILDTKDFDGAVLEVAIGALTGVDATNYLTPVLQHSATTAGDDFEAVDSAYIHGAFTKMDAATEDQVTQVVGYHGTKRYLRVLLDFTGTGITASLAAVIGVLGRPNVSPAATVAAITAT